MRLSKMYIPIYHLIWPEKRVCSCYLYLSFLLILYSLYLELTVFLNQVFNKVVLYKPGIVSTSYEVQLLNCIFKQKEVYKTGILPVKISRDAYSLVVENGLFAYRTNCIYLNNYPIYELAKICDFKIKLFACLKIDNHIFKDPCLYVSDNGVIFSPSYKLLKSIKNSNVSNSESLIIIKRILLAIV